MAAASIRTVSVMLWLILCGRTGYDDGIVPNVTKKSEKSRKRPNYRGMRISDKTDRLFGRMTSSAERYPTGSASVGERLLGSPSIFEYFPGRKPSRGHESIPSSAHAAKANPRWMYVCFSDHVFALSVRFLKRRTARTTFSNFESPFRFSESHAESLANFSSFTRNRSVRAQRTMTWDALETDSCQNDASRNASLVF